METLQNVFLYSTYVNKYVVPVHEKFCNLLQGIPEIVFQELGDISSIGFN